MPSIVFDKQHGSPFDRGGADSYYGRGRSPHYFSGEVRVSMQDMTADEIEAYHAGYDENEELGVFKEWN
jgi:hypothetical protein